MMPLVHEHNKEPVLSIFNWNSCLSQFFRHLQLVMVVDNPSSFLWHEYLANFRLCRTWRHTSFSGWRSFIKPGEQIEDIGQNCFVANHKHGFQMLRKLVCAKWLVNILLLLEPTIFKPSQPISLMHLITETTSVNSNDKITSEKFRRVVKVDKSGVRFWIGCVFNYLRDKTVLQ